MTNSATNANAANIAVLTRAADTSSLQALAVLEQMYGYFSFEPLPLEQVDDRLAA